MKTYISILRGINVSGSNLLKMDLLREMCKDLGFRNVNTYIQSGNVVFQYDESPMEELEQLISTEILKRSGMNVPVLVREYSELKSISEQNPFLQENKADISALYITFLSSYPADRLLQRLKNSSYLPEEFVISGRTVYLYCPNGYGKARLSNSFFENKLKVKATTRNMNTLSELIKIGKQFEDK